MYTDETIQLKIAVIGDEGCGKTSLLVRFIQDYYNDEYNPTIGACVLIKQVTLKEKIIKLTFFDLSGKDQFESTRQLYYRNMNGYLVVISLDQGLDNTKRLRKWFSDIENFVKDDVPIFIAVNKCDLEPDEMDVQAVQELADELAAVVFKVCAKNGEGVKGMFDKFLRIMVKNNIGITTNSLKLDKDKHLLNENKTRCCYM